MRACSVDCLKEPSKFNYEGASCKLKCVAQFITVIAKPTQNFLSK